MKSAVFSLTLLAQIVGTLAFPWMAAPDAAEATQEYLRKNGLLQERALEDRGLLDTLTGTLQSSASGLITGLEGTVGDLVNGLSNALATGVKESDRRPDADHPFREPGPTDQRGPCPGLNALANHGYISRTGIVTADEVIKGTSEGFNMAADLSGVLVLIATAFGGNIATGTFSIGGEDDRTYSKSGIGSKALGRQYGLDAHSRCEGDGESDILAATVGNAQRLTLLRLPSTASATREDFFLNNGDNHSQSPRRFRRFMEHAKNNGGQFNIDAANALWAENAKESLDRNDKLYFEAYTIVVVLGEYPFLPEFFSNGTYGSGGSANLASMSALMGYKVNEDGSICSVPERFPENWYRRATPYGVLNGLIPGLIPTYAKYPLLPNPLSAVLNGGQINEIGCALKQGITSGIPSSLLLSTTDGLSGALTKLQNRLLPGLPNLFGCTVGEDQISGNVTSSFKGVDTSLQEAAPGGGQKVTCA
ncbi:uncharacterized protein JCM10292_005129 [Rhodotorula paludigena]|uniref:uncharacterized protein n=1 Tax=Rhodotorula paludigena TaxID=86838 RepID=UPI00317AB751